MSDNNYPWATMAVEGIKVDTERVAVGMATVLNMDRHKVIVIAASEPALKNFLAAVVPVKADKFLIEPVAVLHADGLSFESIPNVGDDTQQGELPLVPPQDNAPAKIVEQKPADVPVEHGKSPFKHRKPEPPAEKYPPGFLDDL